MSHTANSTAAGHDPLIVFRGQFAVEVLSIDTNHPFRFELPTCDAATVEFRRVSDEEVTEKKVPGSNAICTVQLSLPPPKRVLPALEQLSGGGLPDGSSKPKHWQSQFDALGRFEPSAHVPAELLPNNVQEFFSMRPAN